MVTKTVPMRSMSSVAFYATALQLVTWTRGANHLGTGQRFPRSPCFKSTFRVRLPRDQVCKCRTIVRLLLMPGSIVQASQSRGIVNRVEGVC